METSGTDMLSDSDNRATISPLHLAVSTDFTANLLAGSLKIYLFVLTQTSKLVPRTFDLCNDDHEIKTFRTFFREFLNALLCFILFLFVFLGFPPRPAYSKGENIPVT